MPFVRDIITRMNNEFITRYYSGTGAVLVPSHGIIQVYDILNNRGEMITMTHADVVKEALDLYNGPEGVSNDQIVKDHLNSILPPETVTWDKIQLGDTILIPKTPKPEALELLKIGNYAAQLKDYLNEAFDPENIDLGVQQLMSRFLD